MLRKAMFWQLCSSGGSLFSWAYLLISHNFVKVQRKEEGIKLILHWSNIINPGLWASPFCYWHHRYPKLQILVSRIGIGLLRHLQKREKENAYIDTEIWKTRTAYFTLAMCFLIVIVWYPSRFYPILWVFVGTGLRSLQREIREPERQKWIYSGKRKKKLSKMIFTGNV